ncbi:hypothetical protein SAMN04487904_102276 [Actinopolyspora lacussalsi subsp. righensis]|uniref:Uncharacterized protein n=2 Tax=Actinopolyspora righensis TaxID=995060 RepID=A0A1I6Y7I8_9ACTN|nr:hypothetical protein SAMN04487904_102276 [Actinopolyspora righensis]
MSVRLFVPLRVSHWFETMERALEVRFSDLVNQPKDTLAKLDASRSRHLWLRCRDDEDLVLTTAARAEQENEVVSATEPLDNV